MKGKKKMKTINELRIINQAIQTIKRLYHTSDSFNKHYWIQYNVDIINICLDMQEKETIYQRTLKHGKNNK